MTLLFAVCRFPVAFLLLILRREASAAPGMKILIYFSCFALPITHVI